MANRQVEILAPAGSYESLKAAVSAGADAVYIGGTRFGARAYADNLNEEKLLEAIDYVHLHGRKIYMTVNTLLKDDEMEELYEYLLPYYRQGLDAVIVQDVGVLSFLRTHFPDMAIHISTQMTVVNVLGAEFFKEQGAERIVPARELNLSEIRQMKERTGLEIECFVHGALCYCYSGQCLMSSMIGGRSGNRGQCAQPCRLSYDAGGKKSQDIMSLKDLCTIEMLPELIEAGIDSFKIEGRMKQPDYVYTVVCMYRKYVDLYFTCGKENYKVSENDRRLLQSVYQRRGYSEGYYKQYNGKNMISFERPAVLSDSSECLEKDYKIKEKINGELILSEQSNAKLYLWHQDIMAEYEGDVVQTALNQPLLEERIRKQMEKTGDTEFVFENLNIYISGNIFLPMQALNELRREGIRLLEQEITKKYHRNAENIFPQCDSVAKDAVIDTVIVDHHNKAERECCKMAVLVSEYTQLKTVLNDTRISVIYVDSNLAFTKETKELLLGLSRKQSIYIAMPYIFREHTILQFDKLFDQMSHLYDGVLIRSWESYVWLLNHGYEKEIISDYNLYVFNKKSKAFLKNTKIRTYTASVELNSRELKNLNIQGANLIVYGYQPVMISANCIQKNTKGCTRKDGILYLTDRYKKKFMVKNYCKYCYNITYNPVPLMLLSQAEEIRELMPGYVRLDFVKESADEIKKIIGLYAKRFLDGESVGTSDMEYTKGHFKRGVK